MVFIKVKNSAYLKKPQLKFGGKTKVSNLWTSSMRCLSISFWACIFRSCSFLLASSLSCSSFSCCSILRFISSSFFRSCSNLWFIFKLKYTSFKWLFELENCFYISYMDLIIFDLIISLSKCINSIRSKQTLIQNINFCQK